MGSHNKAGAAPVPMFFLAALREYFDDCICVSLGDLGIGSRVENERM